MSYISDYKVGALSEIEYRNECAMENARARYEESHEDYGFVCPNVSCEEFADGYCEKGCENGSD